MKNQILSVLPSSADSNCFCTYHCAVLQSHPGRYT